MQTPVLFDYDQFGRSTGQTDPQTGRTAFGAGRWGGKGFDNFMAPGKSGLAEPPPRMHFSASIILVPLLIVSSCAPEANQSSQTRTSPMDDLMESFEKSKLRLNSGSITLPDAVKQLNYTYEIEGCSGVIHTVGPGWFPDGVIGGADSTFAINSPRYMNDQTHLVLVVDMLYPTNARHVCDILSGHSMEHSMVRSVNIVRFSNDSYMHGLRAEK